MELVKEIIVNLFRVISSRDSGKTKVEWTPLPVEQFFRSDGQNTVRKISVLLSILFEHHCSLFVLSRGKDTRYFSTDLSRKKSTYILSSSLKCSDNLFKRSDEEGFSRPLVTCLIDALEASPLPHLTPNEQAHLLTLIQTTLEVNIFSIYKKCQFNLI